MSHFAKLANILKLVSSENEVEEYHLTNELITTRSLSNPNLQILNSYKTHCRKCLFLVIGSRLFIEKVILSSKDLSLINMANKWVFVLTERAPIGLLSDQVKDIVSESDILLVQSVRDRECTALHVHCLADLVANVLHKVFHHVHSSPELSSRGQIKNRVLSQSKVSMRVEILFPFENSL